MSTPLYLACENGNAAMVEKLLAAGANPNAALPSGETALMTAARSGSVGRGEGAARARSRRARAGEDGRADRADVGGLAAAPGGRAGADRRRSDVQARSDIRRQVVTRGGGRGAEEDVAVMEEGGYTPLLFASRVGDVVSARLLLAAGADVNDTTPDGASALVVSAHSGHRRSPHFCLENGANPNAAGAGYTALHAAVLRSDPDLVKTLLAHGANPNMPLTRGTVIGRQAKLFMIDGALVGATPFFLAAKFAEPRACATWRTPAPIRGWA